MTTVTIAVVVFLSAAAGLLASRYIFLQPAPEPSDIADCFSSATTTSQAFPSQCLTSTIAKLLQRYPAKELLAYTTSTSTPAYVTAVCHPIGHIIGEQVYKQYGSIEQALAQCTSACRSACTHGVIGAGVLDQLGQQYDDEDIAHASKAELLTLSGPYCSQGSQLCHAIGHVAYIATQNLSGALDVCDSSTKSSSLREACYEGVFMERAGTFINALFPSPDHVLPKTKAGDYTYPCATLQPQYRLACYIFLNSYQTPLFAHDHLSTPQQKLQKAAEVCESLAKPDRAYCFVGIGTSSALFGAQASDPTDIARFCAQFPTNSDQDACIVGVLPQFSYSEYRGLYEYCDSQPNEPQRAFCYNATFQYLERSTKTTGAEKLCEGYQECSARYAIYSQASSTLPKYFQESGFAQ